MKLDPVEVWRGTFGDAYVERNKRTENRHHRKLREWSRLLAAFGNRTPQSILEVGANVGQNLAALRDLTAADLSAVEPNALARAELRAAHLLSPESIHDATAQNLPFADASFDLVFTFGVLIHVAPDTLHIATREIHRVSRRFILCAEYFADQPTEKTYREQKGLLFLRDFGGFWMDSFADLELVDYGFFWRLVDNDSMNWWVFEKRLSR